MSRSTTTFRMARLTTVLLGAWILACETYPGSGLAQTEMKRDEAYRSALATFDALSAIWKQQPGNVAALERTVTRLEEQVSDLRQSEREEVSERPDPAESETEARQRAAPPPRGPFPPSQQPSAEAERAERREATETQLPSGGPLTESETPSLRDVPDVWIEASCDRANAELVRLRDALKEEPMQPDSIDDSLTALERILGEMARPPSEPRQ